MKWFKLFIIFCVTIAYVSCFKDDQHEYSFPNDGLKVSTITEDILYADSQRIQHLYTYSYDSIGRIKGIDADSSFVTFKYSSNFTQKNIYPIVGSAQYYYYYYNNDDRLDSTVWFTESSGDTTYMVYLYDANNLVEKRLDKVISSPGTLKSESYYDYTYDSLGNVTLIQGYSNGGQLIYTSMYNYDYSSFANFSDILEQVSPDAIKNPNLVDVSETMDGLSKYRYRFDNYGRIKEMQVQSVIVFGQGTNNLKQLTYTYY